MLPRGETAGATKDGAVGSAGVTVEEERDQLGLDRQRDPAPPSASPPPLRPSWMGESHVRALPAATPVR